jgi:DNA-binding Lrp family transcriptional regulator
MPNLHKESRNADIIRLFDNGRGLTHREIAEQFGMSASAVSMVIKRWNDRIKGGKMRLVNRLASPGGIRRVDLAPDVVRVETSDGQNRVYKLISVSGGEQQTQNKGVEDGRV